MGVPEFTTEGYFEARYFETYRIALMIERLIENPFPYLRQLEGFYIDGLRYSFLQPFPRESHFHQFIRYVVTDIIFEDLGDFDLEAARCAAQSYGKYLEGGAENALTSPLEYAFDYYDIEHQSFRDWITGQGRELTSATDDDLYDYYCDIRLTQDFEDLLQRIIDEVFFVTFLNRKLMRAFNTMMSMIIISDITVSETPAEYRRFLKSDGVLRRVDPPKWAMKAVFHRERGKCAITKTDLTGTLSLTNKSHYDHVVPLSDGGLNDISNLQLLGSKANLKKSNKNTDTSLFYERWY